MKIFHVADLHIGKKIHEFNLLADQVFILKQVVALAVREQPDVLIIAGDVYDKAIPPAEAVMAFDEFLTDLAANQVPVLLIAGNHDSPERLHFGGRIMAKSQIFPMGVFGGGLVKHTFYDDYGPVHFWLLPFVKPGQVRRFFPEQNIDSYQDAVAAVLAAAKLDNTCRNLLVAHQFVIAGGTEPLRSESETITIGGLDQVDAAVFGDFDYVALGHLHRSQAIGGEQIRYAGSPLKYSFSEARQEKSLTMVELGCKGELHICQLPLQPLHDMREIKGSLATLISSAVVMSADREDYLRVILTDREDLTDPLEQLRMVYPHIMRLDFADKTWLPRIAADQNRVLQDPLTLFGEFYQLQQGSILSDEKREIVRHLLVELEGARV